MLDPSTLFESFVLFMQYFFQVIGGLLIQPPFVYFTLSVLVLCVLRIFLLLLEPLHRW